VKQDVSPVKHRVLFLFLLLFSLYNNGYSECLLPVLLNLDQTKPSQLSCCPHFGAALHPGQYRGQNDLSPDVFAPKRFEQDCQGKVIGVRTLRALSGGVESGIPNCA
jgi:hypothetical protein